MTCKAEVRELLIVSGAITVILDDAQNQVRNEFKRNGIEA